MAEENTLIRATKLKEARSYFQGGKQKPKTESLTTVLNSQLNTLFELQNNIYLWYYTDIEFIGQILLFSIQVQYYSSIYSQLVLQKELLFCIVVIYVIRALEILIKEQNLIVCYRRSTLETVLVPKSLEATSQRRQNTRHLLIYVLLHTEYKRLTKTMD